MGTVFTCCEGTEKEYDQGIKTLHPNILDQNIKTTTEEEAKLIQKETITNTIAVASETATSTNIVETQAALSPLLESGNTYLHASKDGKTILGFDIQSPVFQGSTVDQKFSNKSTYDAKFVWINIESRSINLSEFRSKEKRHKEASLSDVVNVVAGPPEKYKAIVNANGIAEKLDIGTCLSITFVRGGGIDLKFKTEAERDAWYVTLTKLLAFEKNKKK